MLVRRSAQALASILKAQGAPVRPAMTAAAAQAAESAAPSIALSNENLARLPSSVAAPTYPRGAIQEGIVHMGVGGFHRGHEAVYIDDLLEKHGMRDWGICGMGIRAGDRKMHDVMRAQDFAFTVVERDGDHASPRVIGSHTSAMLAPDDAEAAIEKLADPSTRIVSLTVTEAGYCTDDATGAFLTEHKDVQHDLQHPQAPTTWFGYAVEALARRKARGLPPFTVLSCDNLEHNGDRTRRAVVGFAQLRDPALALWIEEKGAFPNSMVDRIVPATKPSDIAFVTNRIGIRDAWPVICEPWRQWVIEDKFAAGRPPLEKVGVQFTPNVAPYETMKLSLLNATHSAMAYLGRLHNFTAVDETMRDPTLQRFLVAMMAREITPILPPVPGVDLAAYRQMLVKRFTNEAIGDSLDRLELNGSAKLPKFLFPSLRAQLAKGGEIERMTTSIAAWCRYLSGTDEQGREIASIDDPLKAELMDLAKQGGADPRPLLSMQSVFGTDLPKNERFVSTLGTQLEQVYARGIKATLAACNDAE